MAFNKVQVFHKIIEDDGSVTCWRLQDPDHFSRFLQDQGSGRSFRLALVSYVSQHGGTLAVRADEDGTVIRS